MWNTLQLFSSGVILSKVAKYSKSSPMISSFQDNAYIYPITQKHLNVQPQNLCHWNWHIEKATCREYQAILSISSWSKQGFFFHSISCLEAIFVAEKYTNKIVFDQEELFKITWKSPPRGFWACQFQWWWLKVCHQKHQYVCHVLRCAITLLDFLLCKCIRMWYLITAKKGQYQHICTQCADIFACISFICRMHWTDNNKNQ